jgi:hypothetical protein
MCQPSCSQKKKATLNSFFPHKKRTEETDKPETDRSSKVFFFQSVVPPPTQAEENETKTTSDWVTIYLECQTFHNGF